MTQYHLHLKGYVGGADFNTESVLATLAANPDAEVSVLVDSTGGQLATALSISSAFHRHGKVHVHFSGMNASAATISSLGAQRISMDASALYLVHKCSMAVFEWASMNADQLQEYIDGLSEQKTQLDKLDSHVAAMYAARCRKPQADLLALMKTGGWLTAAEAKEWGFVDDITDYEEDIRPMMTEALATALATASIPIPSIPYADAEAQKTAEPLFSRFLSALTALFHPAVKADETAVQVSDSNHNQEDNQTQTPNTSIITPMKQMPKLEAALQIGSFKANAEGGVSLTEAQLQCLEDLITAQDNRLAELDSHIAEQDGRLAEQDSRLAEQEGKVTAQASLLTERDNRIAELEAEVTALKATPADSSSSVVNAQKGEPASKNPSDDFFSNYQDARRLYDFVS